MSATVAAVIHFTLLAGALVTWVFALRAHRRAFAPVDRTDPTLLAQGEVDVDRPADEVRDGVVRTLKTAQSAPLGTVELEEVDARRIAGQAYPFAGSGSQKGLPFEIRLLESGRRTTGLYRIRREGGSGLRIASGLFVYFLAPLAMTAAAMTIPLFVLPSEDTAVRVQAVQTVQVVHFVWPPFLFAGLHRRVVGVVERILRTSIRNTGIG